MKYACGMVCEYLPKELATELENSYRYKNQQRSSLNYNIIGLLP